MGTIEPGTKNVMGGHVAGPAVQAGAIHGGVHVHQARSPRLPIPRQLPPPPAHLVGRERELAEIDGIAARARGGPVVVVLGGVGGVGKSALALAWAHDAGERYPDGQLYANLGAYGAGSLFAQMLRAFDVAAESVPTGVAEQGALFRSLTAGKALLMLLDDATSAAQVRPFLPASSSTVVLVTTRGRLDGLHGDGAAFVAVEPLDDEPATALLAAAVGHERVARDPAATSALVRLCAGLPHALAMAAARLVVNPAWPVGRMVEEIAQEPDIGPPVAAAEPAPPRQTVNMTAINSTNVYQAAGDQYFIE